MKKAFWNILKVSPAVALILLAGNSAFAGEVNGNVTSVAELSQESNSLGQVTSVSQFSDVQPSDWAFKALQSLVERYRCVAGSPNGTFRGNRTLTRFEFAAALNSCLDSINEILSTATAEMVTKQDLVTLQRLQDEYSSELATIRGQVDALEARTGELEANQFSTTTKLSGEAIFSVSQVFGKPVGSTTDINSTTTLSDRVRLSLNSSFTGKDQLQTRLQGRNIVSNKGITGTDMTRLGYDGSEGNAISIDKLNYAFNLSDKVRVKIDATGGELNENVNVFNPDFRSSGTGALSRYGRFSPIYRLADDGAGITVNVTPNDKLELSAAYFAAGRNTASSPLEQQGLFDGNNTLFGQLAFKPNKAINVGLTYAHAYRVGAEPKLFGDTGSVYANKWDSVANDRTESNNYGLQVSLQPSSKITLGGWAGYTTASTLVGTPNSAEMFYWATTLGVKDFLKEGNTLGFIFGQQPKLTGSTQSGKSNFDALKAAGLEKSTSYHIEGLYKIKLSDNILITPGALLIINPENNDKNGKELVGTLRTTFTF
ncbi:MAG: hypothetical protein AN488_14040 [Anabaena sp. WA113]|nr:MAG: hypothetical protein AN488_14040 [Anabaena sp. WA113]